MFAEETYYTLYTLVPDDDELGGETISMDLAPKPLLTTSRE